MILSVLIPSVPSRHAQACSLFDKISKQAEGLDVEVLMLCDNKKRSVGKKRGALVQASRGNHVAFVDDDDDVSCDYIERLYPVAFLDKSDVIVFNSLVTLDGGPKVLCEHRFLNADEPYSPEGFKRGAWHIHAWRGELARSTPFPDISYGEDVQWCEAMRKKVVTWTSIFAPLYHYRFNSQTTEAANV